MSEASVKAQGLGKAEADYSLNPTGWVNVHRKRREAPEAEARPRAGVAVVGVNGAAPPRHPARRSNEGSRRDYR